MKYFTILLFVGFTLGQEYDPESGEILLKNYNPNTGQKIILNDSLKVLAKKTAINYIKDSLSVDSVVVSNWTFFGALSLPLSIISSKVFLKENLKAKSTKQNKKHIDAKKKHPKHKKKKQ